MIQPLVSVVTPVYNGEKYLSQCIESVRTQTYERWEYLIINNCSTDNTLAIAQKYAECDSRIKVVDNSDFLNLIENWNYAMNQISSDSKYCKVIHADDLLFPDCIKKMVVLAENNFSVGMVGSYYLVGDKVRGHGIEFQTSVKSGKDVCQSVLKQKYYMFGSPTSTLIRSDLVRKRKNFYNKNYFHADVEVCLDILQTNDFGFVHQILSYTRLHEDTQTATKAEILGSNGIDNLKMLKEYGPVYFNDNEYKSLFKSRVKKYKHKVVMQVLRKRNLEFIKYQYKGLKDLNLSFRPHEVILIIANILLDKLLNPKRTIEQLYKKFQ